jgi:hypothetical protein
MLRLQSSASFSNLQVKQLSSAPRPPSWAGGVTGCDGVGAGRSLAGLGDVAQVGKLVRVAETHLWDR